MGVLASIGVRERDGGHLCEVLRWENQYVFGIDADGVDI